MMRFNEYFKMNSAEEDAGWREGVGFKTSKPAENKKTISRRTHEEPDAYEGRFDHPDHADAFRIGV